MINLERAWLMHLGAYEPRFPREVCYEVGGHFTREWVYNPTEYVQLCRRRAERGNLWVGTQSKQQMDRDIWDKIYLDVDSSDLQVSYTDMVDLTDYLVGEYNAEARVCFTTNKGFGVYIDIPPTRLSGYQVKQWVTRLKDKMDLSLDVKVSSDKRRVCRLPFTWNTKSLRFGELRMCVPVDPAWSYERILDESRRPTGHEHHLDPSPQVSEEIASERDYSPSEVDIVAPPPELNMEALKTIAQFVGDGRHRIMFHMIIPTCLLNGLTDYETMAVLEEFINETGKPFAMGDYREYGWRSIQWHRENPGVRPQTLERLMNDEPEIVRSFGYDVGV